MGTSSRGALRTVRATIRKKCWERKFLVPIKVSTALRRRFSSNAITLCCCKKHDLPFQGARRNSSGRTAHPIAHLFARTRQDLVSHSKLNSDACLVCYRRRRQVKRQV